MRAGPVISPPFCYARRSARCDGAYFLQPARRSVSYAFAVFRSVPPSQRHLDALATNGGEICGLAGRPAPTSAATSGGRRRPDVAQRLMCALRDVAGETQFHRASRANPLYAAAADAVHAADIIAGRDEPGRWLSGGAARDALPDRDKEDPAAPEKQYGRHKSDDCGGDQCHGGGVHGSARPDGWPRVIRATMITWSDGDFNRDRVSPYSCIESAIALRMLCLFRTRTLCDSAMAH